MLKVSRQAEKKKKADVSAFVNEMQMRKTIEIKTDNCKYRDEIKLKEIEGRKGES